MSRDGSLERFFGDGEYRFRLAWKQLEKLQERLDCGPLVILDRLLKGHWMIADVREVIRWGLIGGGMDVNAAAKMILLYATDQPPMLIAPKEDDDDPDNLSLVGLAAAILGASLVGSPDEEQVMPVGKLATPNESTRSPTGSFGSESSTSPVQ